MLPRLGLLWLLLCACAASLAGEREAITIVYGAHYAPFAMGDEHLARGIQRDFVQRVLGDRLGLQVVHETYPWKRAQRMVQDGERDGFFTVPTEERAAYTVASAIPFYETHFVMHTARDNPQLARLRQVLTLDDLAALPELRHIHMHGSGWHEAALKGMKRVQPIVDATRVPQMLVQGRADLYIEQTEMLRYQARQLGVADRIVSLQETSLRKLGWHLFLSKSSRHVGKMAAINEELARLKASGELERIRKEVFALHGVE